MGGERGGDVNERGEKGVTRTCSCRREDRKEKKVKDERKVEEESGGERRERGRERSKRN